MDDDAVDEEDRVVEAEDKPVDVDAADEVESERGFLDADGCGIGEPSPGASVRVPGLGTGDGGYRALVFARPEAAPVFTSARVRVGCIKMRLPTGLEVRRNESGLNEARNGAPTDFLASVPWPALCSLPRVSILSSFFTTRLVPLFLSLDSTIAGTAAAALCSRGGLDSSWAAAGEGGVSGTWIADGTGIGSGGVCATAVGSGSSW